MKHPYVGCWPLGIAHRLIDSDGGRLLVEREPEIAKDGRQNVGNVEHVTSGDKGKP